jgi:hypothetical protein
MLCASTLMRLELPMKLSCKSCAIAVMLLAGAIARAAPPTVTPSPGYDARLQEQRAAAAAARAMQPEAAPIMPVTPRHHKKPKRN